jgi:hypothetical protein
VGQLRRWVHRGALVILEIGRIKADGFADEIMALRRPGILIRNSVRSLRRPFGCESPVPGIRYLRRRRHPVRLLLVALWDRRMAKRNLAPTASPGSFSL